jgi:hypothetical protein
MKVYVLIESTSTDYHGSYKEIIGVYETQSKVLAAINELQSSNTNWNIAYDYEVFEVN